MWQARSNVGLSVMVRIGMSWSARNGVSSSFRCIKFQSGQSKSRMQRCGKLTQKSNREGAGETCSLSFPLQLFQRLGRIQTPSCQGSPSRRPRARPGPLLVGEGVDGGAVGLRGVVVIASIPSGSVGDDGLGVPVPDVALQGLLQPPLAGSVDQVDSGFVEPTETALELAGASEVRSERRPG